MDITAEEFAKKYLMETREANEFTEEMEMTKDL